VQFADTNVLLYTVSTAIEEKAKARVARQLLDSGDIGLSVQVLQEFYVQATRSTKPDRLAHDQALALIEAFCRFRVQELTLALVRAALASCKRFRISYWDAAVVEAARLLGCREVLSEDLAHGRDYDGVTVVNPFRSRARGARRG
jgi:predicted nucleic acid-binding protein